MKKNYFLWLVAIFLFVSMKSYGQEIQKNYINYQGIARGADGNLLEEENIEIGIALRFGSSAATVVYEETHQLETDANGVFNLQIGDGNLINGSYASLPWGNAAFMTVSMNGVEVGTTELMAVPYAIASGDKQWVVNGSDIENKNEGEVAIQNNLRVKGGFNLSTGNQVNEISDNGTLSENSNGILPTQRAVKTYVDNRFFAGGGVEQNAGEVPYDNTVSGLTAVNAQDAIDELASAGEGADADADPTNELQNLTLTGTNLEISDGTGVDLSGIIPPGGTDDQTAAEVPFNNTGTGLVATDTQSALEELAAGGLVDTDNQDLSLSGTVLNITDGTGVDLSGIIPPGGTDDQTAAEVPFNNSGTGLAATDAQAALEELAAGGLVDTDNQGLILTGDVLSIEDGAGSIDLSNYVDVTGESGLLVGDGANISGLEGTADGQVAKWNAALGQWIAGTDEIGGGGSSLWEENGSDIYFDSGSVGVGNSAPGVESGASTYLTVATGTSPGDNALASVEIQGGQGSTNQPIGRLDFISNSSPGNSAITRIETKTAGGAQFRGDLGFFTKDGAAYGSSTLQERFTIKYNGNIGVGVTNPTEKFDVDGTIKSRDLAGVGQRNVVADANGNLVIGGSGGGSSLWSVNGTNIHFNTGNVGIGTATPSSPIEIVSINDSPILIESTRADGNGWIRFNKPSGRIGYVGMYSDNGVNDIEMGTTGNNTSGRLHLTSRGNPRLTVNDNNVGIGVTDPTEKLDVDGTIKSRDLAGAGQRNVVADANGNLVIGGSGGGSSLWSVNGTNIHFNTGNVGIGTATPSSPIEIVSINDSPILIESTRADGNGWIRFNKPSGRIGYVGMYSDNGVNDIEMGTTGNNTSGRLHLTSRGNPKLTVDDNNVGVGTTSPSAKLHINQGGQAVGTGLRFSDGINDDWDITHGFGLRFHYGGVLRGFINANNGAYVQSSDKRLKSEIELLENVLGKVKELKPKTYYYKSDISRNRTIGLIAQEVQGLFPELVSSNNEDGMLGLEYSAFAVIAIKAIQEQQTLIETQSERIMALEERLVRLEKNLSK